MQKVIKICPTSTSAKEGGSTVNVGSRSMGALHVPIYNLPLVKGDISFHKCLGFSKECVSLAGIHCI